MRFSMFASEAAAFDILLAQEDADLEAQQACALALAKPSAKMKAKKKIAFFMSQSELVEKVKKYLLSYILWFAWYRGQIEPTCPVENLAH